ncbi:MAG: O-antigen ligase family protein [Candidatus Methylomirabilia bacterium]
MSSTSVHRALYLGLLLFGLSLPLSKGASNVLLGVLYLSAIAGALYSREFRDDVIRNFRQPLAAALALFSLVAYIGIMYTQRFADGFSVANKFVSLPAIYVLVSALLDSNRGDDDGARKPEFLLFSFLAGLTALNLFGLTAFLGVIGEEKYLLPLAPLGLHHIWYSNINALGLYTAVSLLLFSRHGATARGRALLGSFLALSAAAILLSTSRTAWFSIALTAAIMAAVALKSKKMIMLVALLFLLAFTALYRFVPLVHDRTDLIARDIALFVSDKRAVTSVGGRIMMWRAALAMFKSHPVIGVGTGDYGHTLRVLRKAKSTRKLVPKLLLHFNQPHNMYLFSMATNGSAGLAALLFIFYRSLRFAVPTVRSGNGEKLFAFLAMATVVHFMIAGFMDSFFNIQILRYAFAFVLGVCIRSSVTRVPRP